MNNEELDSQLSAMFDDELPEPECELLARRLARDEGLKARWGRYAAIGACIRMERGGESASAAGAPRAGARQAGAPNGEARAVRTETRAPRMRLNAGLAGRVSRAIAAEPPLLAGSALSRSVRRLAHPAIGRWWQPVAGGATVAAAVAASAILWLRAGSPDAPILAQNALVAATADRPAGAALSAPRVVRVTLPGPGAQAAHGRAASQDSFVVPPAAPASSFAPPIELANFVVAHSEYSMPLLRRSALSALVADEPLTDDAAEDATVANRGSSAAGGGTAQGDAAVNDAAVNGETPDRSNASHADSSR